MSVLDLRDQRILVTGGSGFLGTHLCGLLTERGCKHVSAPLHSSYDIREQTTTHRMLWEHESEIVFHLAAKCGGIGANMQAQADFIHDNLRMGLNVIDACRKLSVRKLVLIGTICSYPEIVNGPIRESDLWNGYPEPTNAPYGIAKRTLIEVAKAYHKQYGLNVVNVLPANLYGPGDNFDPLTSHVIPAMIRRFTDATRSGLEQVSCWGSGKPTRDFLYVEDAAEAIVRAAERVESPEPINIGTGLQTSTRWLADKLAQLCGFYGTIRWDRTRPDGQLKRVLDTSRMKQAIEFEPATSLEEGLRRTVEWWKDQSREVGEFRHKPGLRDVPDPIEKE